MSTLSEQAWKAMPGMLTPRAGACIARHGNIIHIIGGYTGTSGFPLPTAGDTKSVDSFRIQSDGSLSPVGSAGLVAPNGEGIGAAMGFVSGGYLYVVGGSNDFVQSSVYRARIDGSGNIVGTFSVGDSNGMNEPDAGITNNGCWSPDYKRLWLLTAWAALPGGSAGNNIYTIKMLSDGSFGGQLGALKNQSNPHQWQLARVMTKPAGLGTNGTLAEWGGYLYTIGGFNPSVPTADIYSMKINDDGTLSPEQLVGCLPAGSARHAWTQVGNRVFIAGGTVTGSDFSANATMIQLESGGGCRIPVALAPLPNVVRAPGMFEYNGYVYVIGGYDTITTYNQVLRMRIV